MDFILPILQKRKVRLREVVICHAVKWAWGHAVKWVGEMG